jgi:hypothetical protein
MSAAAQNLTPDELRGLEEKLKSARPRLIAHCDLDAEDERQATVTSYIRESELSGDQILDEGFDPEYSPLGVPVYWRVIVRGDERLYCSTFQATRERIIKGWGQIGLEHADPGNGTAVVCLETVIDPATPVRGTSKSAVDEDLRHGHECAEQAAHQEPSKITIHQTPPNGGVAMSQNRQITLDDLTSALKAVYGQNAKVPLLIFRHWAARNQDISEATPELIRELEESYLKTYRATAPLERSKALDLLNVYGEHFYKTASPEERAVLAVASGYTPLEYEIMGEGFSLRELMRALRAFEGQRGPAPEDMLICFFERYYLRIPWTEATSCQAAQTHTAVSTRTSYGIGRARRSYPQSVWG